MIRIGKDAFRTFSPVLLAYLDESYTRDRYYIAAVLVPDVQAVALTHALDGIVAAAASTGQIPAGAELHGRDLYQGKGDWAGWWKTVRARIRVFRDAVQAIADHAAVVVIESVEIAQLAADGQPVEPHSHVLMLLLERVDRLAADREEFVLVIADEIPAQESHRRKLRERQDQLSWGDRIVDTIHFAPSSASRLLQAVDLVVYLYRRLETDQDTSERARQANLAIWARVEPCLVAGGRQLV
jgi:Protein of unknown function (DUF3800)